LLVGLAAAFTGRNGLAQWIWAAGTIPVAAGLAIFRWSCDSKWNFNLSSDHFFKTGTSTLVINLDFNTGTLSI
jgi:hypothetical protein